MSNSRGKTRKIKPKISDIYNIDALHKIMRKGAPHTDRTKYNRKQKHGKGTTEEV